MTKTKTAKPPKIKPPTISPAVPWSVSTIDANSHRVTFKFETQTRRIDTFPTLHISDVHWDSVHCRRDILARDLDLALAVGAPVFIYGDLFDLMQGKMDKRGHKSGVRPEYEGDKHFDLIEEDALKWWQKYIPILAFISHGNHETGYQKYHERDFLASFGRRLRQAGSPCVVGGYWGYVCLQGRVDAHKQVSNLALHYHHGYGGGGEVTRGFIDNNRTRGQFEADLYLSGHIHRVNADKNVITYMDRLGKICQREQWFLRSGTYKDEQGTQGYHVEKGRAARPLGGWWLDLSMERSGSTQVLHATPRPTRGDPRPYRV